MLYRLLSLSVHCYSRCQPPAVAPCRSRCPLQCRCNANHAAETFLFLFFLFVFHCLARCYLRRAAFRTVGSQPRALPPPRPALPRSLPSPARAQSCQRCRAGAVVPCRVSGIARQYHRCRALQCGASASPSMQHWSTNVALDTFDALGCAMRNALHTLPTRCRLECQALQVHRSAGSSQGRACPEIRSRAGAAPCRARSRARGWARPLPATYPKCPHIKGSIPIAQTAPTLQRVCMTGWSHCARVNTYRISISVSMPVNSLKPYITTRLSRHTLQSARDRATRTTKTNNTYNNTNTYIHTYIYLLPICILYVYPVYSCVLLCTRVYLCTPVYFSTR